jgi:hypothetical protein
VWLLNYPCDNLTKDHGMAVICEKNQILVSLVLEYEGEEKQPVLKFAFYD